MRPAAPPLAPSLEESIVLTLVDLANHLTRNGQALAGSAGLTVGQWLLLLQVAGDPNFPSPPEPPGEPGITASRVARERGTARASVSPLVTALVRKRLLTQADAADDRRRKVLAITARGRTALERIEPHRRRANADLFAPYERRELESVLRVLRGCLGRILRARAEEPAARLGDGAHG